MKSIEERAKEWGEHIVETTPYDVVDGKACVFVEDRNIADVAEESYIAGATEQKAIDDAECINQVLMGRVSTINYDAENHYKQGYHDAVEKAYNIFCHTGCPHKTDSYNCLNNKCDTWEIFRRMLEEEI